MCIYSYTFRWKKDDCWLDIFSERLFTFILFSKSFLHKRNGGWQTTSMLKQTFLASFRIFINTYSYLQQNKIHIRYNINTNQVINNLSKNCIDDKFVQKTIYNLYYLHNYTNEQHTPSSNRSFYEWSSTLDKNITSYL